MCSVHSIAVYLGRRLAKQAGSDIPVNNVIYGIEVVAGALIKIISLFAVSTALGIAPVTFAVLTAAGSFRMLTGGAHCTAFYRCLLSSMIIFPALGFLSAELHNLTPLQLSPVMLAAAYTLYRWAPFPPENKPIKCFETIKKRKIYAVTAYAVFAVVLLFSNVGIWHYAIFTGLSWQAFTLAPYGHSLVSALDRLLTRKGGVPG